MSNPVHPEQTEQETSVHAPEKGDPTAYSSELEPASEGEHAQNSPLSPEPVDQDAPIPTEQNADSDSEAPIDEAVTQSVEPSPSTHEESLRILHKLEATLGAFHERAANLEKINLEMHERMKDLQQDAVFSFLRPVFDRLATLYSNAVEYASDQESKNASDDLLDISEQVLDIFQLFDIQSLETEKGQTFDAHVHNAFQRKVTEEPDLDGKIARVRRQGFKRSGAERVFIPAQVAVFRYQEPTAKTSYTEVDGGAHQQGRT